MNHLLKKLLLFFKNKEIKLYLKDYESSRSISFKNMFMVKIDDFSLSSYIDKNSGPIFIEKVTTKKFPKNYFLSGLLISAKATSATTLELKLLNGEICFYVKISNKNNAYHIDVEDKLTSLFFKEGEYHFVQKIADIKEANVFYHRIDRDDKYGLPLFLNDDVICSYKGETQEGKIICEQDKVLLKTKSNEKINLNDATSIVFANREIKNRKTKKKIITHILQFVEIMNLKEDTYFLENYQNLNLKHKKVFKNDIEKKHNIICDFI